MYGANLEGCLKLLRSNLLDDYLSTSCVFEHTTDYDSSEYWHKSDSVAYAWIMVFQNLLRRKSFVTKSSDIHLLKILLKSRQVSIKIEALRCLCALKNSQVRIFVD